MLHVARRLYRELTGADPGRANRFELSEELIALLAGREWLLVVDEAQLLNRECIDDVAFLLGHRNANVTRAVYVRELADARRRTMRRSRMVAEFGDLLQS
jgi:hypothetical protein